MLASSAMGRTSFQRKSGRSQTRNAGARNVCQGDAAHAGRRRPRAHLLILNGAWRREYPSAPIATRSVVENAIKKSLTKSLRLACGSSLTAQLRIVAETAPGDGEPLECGLVQTSSVKKHKPIAEFSTVRERLGEQVHGGRSRVCNDCVFRREEQEANVSKQSAAQVQKKGESDERAGTVQFFVEALGQVQTEEGD